MAEILQLVDGKNMLKVQLVCRRVKVLVEQSPWSVPVYKSLLYKFLEWEKEVDRAKKRGDQGDFITGDLRPVWDKLELELIPYKRGSPYGLLFPVNFLIVDHFLDQGEMIKECDPQELIDNQGFW